MGQQQGGAVQTGQQIPATVVGKQKLVKTRIVVIWPGGENAETTVKAQTVGDQQSIFVSTTEGIRTVQGIATVMADHDGV